MKTILKESEEKFEYGVDFVFDEDDFVLEDTGGTAELIMITSENDDFESEERSEFWLNIEFTIEGRDHEGFYKKDLGYIDNFVILDVVLMYPEKKVLDEMFIDMFINDAQIYKGIFNVLQGAYEHQKNGKWNDEHTT